MRKPISRTFREDCRNLAALTQIFAPVHAAQRWFWDCEAERLGDEWHNCLFVRKGEKEKKKRLIKKFLSLSLSARCLPQFFIVPQLSQKL